MGEHLTKKQVLDAYYAEGTLKEIAEDNGMSMAHVSRIKRGLVHREITADLPRIPRKNYKSLRSTLKLPDERVREIEARTDSVRSAAKALGLAQCTIHKYRKLARSIGVAL
jgi:hypothetical protein